jgi:hypothetical protein
MMRFGIKPCKKNQINFNSILKLVSVLSNADRKYYQCIPKKEVGVQISKRRCNIGSYKGEVARLHLFFFCQKTVIVCFENIISPTQLTSRCRDWLQKYLAVDCFVILNRPPNL